MRVISLYQPYATLMVLGFKTNETRSWDTKVRGPLLIHASANMPKWCSELLDKPFFVTALNGVVLPKGAILGQVDLIDTIDTHTWMESQIRAMSPEPGQQLNLFDSPLEHFQREVVFGDYSKGRFAWQTANPIQFDKPISAKGSQGFWKYDL